MNMPNRRAQVYVICEKNPASFPQDDTNDACRRELLLGTIIPSLNRMDDGCWGYMTKTDQGNKVPCDIMMWKDTNEVVDCMTGTGGTWIPHDPPPPEWQWTAVGSTPTPVPPEPGPTPPTPLAYDEGQVEGFIADIRGVYESAQQFFDGRSAIWTGRMQYDAFFIGYQEARAKQLAACKSVLGV